MLRTYIHTSDFGRTMRMVIVKDTAVQGRWTGHVLVPMGRGQYELRPIAEGTRIKDEDVFLELPHFEAQEFFQSLVVALAQHGFITPDRSGTELKETKEHIQTLVGENTRKQNLLEKLVEAITRPIVSLPAVLESTGRKSHGR
jgi:hypothetical protein